MKHNQKNQTTHKKQLSWKLIKSTSKLQRKNTENIAELTKTVFRNYLDNIKKTCIKIHKKEIHFFLNIANHATYLKNYIKKQPWLKTTKMKTE